MSIYDVSPQVCGGPTSINPETAMPTYNRNFQLTINDVDQIEEALRARGRELCTMRRALSEANPADMESIRVIERDQRAGEELLGRLHDQKIFYRPQGAVYVSG
ncbi:hypothetical protein ACFQD0_15080 [Sulfitobacter aestuariivivens]